jgi:hypothetical protein
MAASAPTVLPEEMQRDRDSTQKSAQISSNQLRVSIARNNPKRRKSSEKRKLPIGENLALISESATREQSMSARRPMFPSLLGSPLAELRVFISPRSLLFR